MNHPRTFTNRDHEIERSEFACVPLADESGAHWRRVALNDSEAAWALGRMHGIQFIGHARKYGVTPMDYAGERLVETVEEMTGGKLGLVERGFLTALGDFIATGRVLGFAPDDAVLRRQTGA